jgi:hypothetical protein
MDPESFYATAYDAVLEGMIAHVIEVEGPVLADVLARRIARAHGWQRTGARIQERVEYLARKVHPTTREDVGTFYWPKDRGPEQPVAFRRSPDDSARAADEICMPEMTSLARAMLATGKRGEDAVQGIARMLGLQRLRVATRVRIECALDLAATTARSSSIEEDL